MSGAEETPQDALARMRADLDQAASGMAEMGQVVWAFYSGCTKAGFTPDQALTLAVAFLREQIAGSLRGE